MHFLLILGVSETAVSGVLCPSLAVTGVSMAAELGTGVGVLIFDVMTVTVPVHAISMLRETVIRHQGLFWRVIGEHGSNVISSIWSQITGTTMDSEVDAR
jgi:hypothetical protein